MDSFNGEIGMKHIISWVKDHPWAILESKLEQILSVIQLRALGLTLTEKEVEARIGRNQPRQRSSPGSTVAVIPVFGTIAHRMNMFHDISGGTSTEMLGKSIRTAIDDSDVSSVVLDIDSPGGSVYGVEELHRDIMGFRGAKPVVAVANAMAGSAAYYLASAADEIVVTPSGTVGSIGVLGIHWDQSEALEKEGIKPTIIHAGKHKIEGHSFGPLEDDARTHFQKEIDNYYSMFVKAVARGRAVSVKDVRGERFGEGRMFMAKEALERGLVDRVDTLDNTITRLARTKATASAPTPTETTSESPWRHGVWTEFGNGGTLEGDWDSEWASVDPTSVATLRAELDTLEEEIRVRKDLG